MNALPAVGQTASRQALMEALGILSFSEDEFQRAIKEAAATGTFLGRADHTEFLSVVRRWRRFFTPCALYGHRLGADVAILSDYPFSQHDDLLVTDRSRLSKNAVFTKDSAERIRLAQERGVPLIGFFGGSTVQGYGTRLPQYAIPAQVERLLALRHGREVVCLNYGIAGWTCAESLRLLTQEATGNLDVAVFYDGWNCCSEFYLLALAARCCAGSCGTLPSVFPGTSLRHVELDLIGQRHFSAGRLAVRSFRLAVNQFVTVLTDAFASPRLRRLAHALLQRCFSIADGRLLRRQLDQVMLSNEEEAAVLSEAANEYLRTHAKIARWCGAYGIRRLHVLQPLLANSAKAATPREEMFRRSGLPWGRPHVPVLFRRAVQGCTGMIDLSDLFDAVGEEVFLDAGHLNMRGNFEVALRLADMLGAELAALPGRR